MGVAIAGGLQRLNGYIHVNNPLPTQELTLVVHITTFKPKETANMESMIGTYNCTDPVIACELYSTDDSSWKNHERSTSFLSKVLTRLSRIERAHEDET